MKNNTKKDLNTMITRTTSKRKVKPSHSLSSSRKKRSSKRRLLNHGNAIQPAPASNIQKQGSPADNHDVDFAFQTQQDGTPTLKKSDSKVFPPQLGRSSRQAKSVVSIRSCSVKATPQHSTSWELDPSCDFSLILDRCSSIYEIEQALLEKMMKMMSKKSK